MKTLYLVRHAKSDWDDPMLPDFDRPLNKRGKQDLPLMARRLTEQGVLPDLIISSPAKRTRKTARGLASQLGYAKDDILFQNSIYEAGTTDLLTVIQGVSARHNTVMLVGHNPGITALANRLANARIQNVPTLGIVAIAFDTDQWSMIVAGSGELRFFDYPKNDG